MKGPASAPLMARWSYERGKGRTPRGALKTGLAVRRATPRMATSGAFGQRGEIGGADRAWAGGWGSSRPGFHRASGGPPVRQRGGVRRRVSRHLWRWHRGRLAPRALVRCPTQSRCACSTLWIGTVTSGFREALKCWKDRLGRVQALMGGRGVSLVTCASVGLEGCAEALRLRDVRFVVLGCVNDLRPTACQIGRASGLHAAEGHLLHLAAAGKADCGAAAHPCIHQSGLGGEGAGRGGDMRSVTPAGGRCPAWWPCRRARPPPRTAAAWPSWVVATRAVGMTGRGDVEALMDRARRCDSAAWSFATATCAYDNAVRANAPRRALPRTQPATPATRTRVRVLFCAPAEPTA